MNYKKFIFVSLILILWIPSFYNPFNEKIRKSSVKSPSTSTSNFNLTPNITNWEHWENTTWYADPKYDSNQMVWFIEKDTLIIDYENCKVTYFNPLVYQGGYDNNTGLFDTEMTYQWRYMIEGDGFDLYYSVKYFSYEERNVTDYSYTWFFNQTIPSYTNPVVNLVDNASVVSFNVTYDNCVRFLYSGDEPLNSVESNFSIVFGYHIWYNGTQVKVKIDQDIPFNYLNQSHTPNLGKFQITNEYAIRIGDQTINPSTGLENSVYYEIENKNVSSFIMNPNYDILWKGGGKTNHNVTYIDSTDEIPEGYFITEFKHVNWTTERIIYDPTIELDLGYFSSNSPSTPEPPEITPISIPFYGLNFIIFISLIAIFFKMKRKISSK